MRWIPVHALRPRDVIRVRRSDLDPSGLLTPLRDGAIVTVCDHASARAVERSGEIVTVWCNATTKSTHLLLYPSSALVEVLTPDPTPPLRTTLEEMAEVLVAVLVCALYWPALLWAGGVL